jgi:hypothetical protein
MAIRDSKLAKYKALITINMGAVNPSNADVSSDFSKLQAKLDSDKRASEVFGMDFLMFAEKGLFAEGRDLKKATGIFNFGQAVTHRLMTTRGTMPGDPFFGVPWGNYLGQTYRNKSLLLADLRSEVENEVLKDFRTGQILNFNLKFLDVNTVSIDMTIVPIFTSLDESVNLLITAGV